MRQTQRQSGAPLTWIAERTSCANGPSFDRLGYGDLTGRPEATD